MEGDRILQNFLKSQSTESISAVARDVQNYLSLSWKATESNNVKFAVNHSNFSLKLLRCCIEAFKNANGTSFTLIFDIAKNGLRSLQVALDNSAATDQITLASRLEKLLFHTILFSSKDIDCLEAFIYFSKVFYWLCKLQRKIDSGNFEKVTQPLIRKAYDIHLSVAGKLQKSNQEVESKIVICVGFRLLFLCSKYHPLLTGHLEQYVTKVEWWKQGENVIINAVETFRDLIHDIIQEFLAYLLIHHEIDFLVNLFRINFSLFEVWFSLGDLRESKILKDYLNTLLSDCNSQDGKTLLKYLLVSIDMHISILAQRKCICGQQKGLDQLMKKYEVAMTDLLNFFTKNNSSLAIFSLNICLVMFSVNEKQCTKFLSFAMKLVGLSLQKAFPNVKGKCTSFGKIDKDIFGKFWCRLFVWIHAIFQVAYKSGYKVCKQYKDTMEFRSEISETFLQITRTSTVLAKSCMFGEDSQFLDRKWISSCLYNAGILCYKLELYSTASQFFKFSLSWLMERFCGASSTCPNKEKMIEGNFVKKCHLFAEACKKSGEIEECLDYMQSTINSLALTHDDIQDIIDTLCKCWVDVQIAKMVKNSTDHSQDTKWTYRSLSDVLLTETDANFVLAALKSEYDQLSSHVDELSLEEYGCALKSTLESRIVFYERRNEVTMIGSSYLELVNLQSNGISEDSRIELCDKAIELLRGASSAMDTPAQSIITKELLAQLSYTRGILKYTVTIAHGGLKTALDKRSAKLDGTEDFLTHSIYNIWTDLTGLDDMMTALNIFQDLLSSHSEIEELLPYLYNIDKMVESTLQMGLFFSLLRQDSEAIRSLRICINCCNLLNDRTELSTTDDNLMMARASMATILARNYLFPQAAKFSSADNMGSNYTGFTSLHILASKIDVLLRCKKISAVEELLTELRASKHMEGKSRKAVLFRAEELMLRSQLVQLKQLGKEDESTEGILDLQLEAMNILRTLASLTDGISSTMTYFLLDRLLTCLYMVGDGYERSGAIVEALHYFKEGAELADLYCLPTRFLVFKVEIQKLLHKTANADEIPAEGDPFLHMLDNLDANMSKNVPQDDAELFNLSLHRCYLCIQLLNIESGHTDVSQLTAVENYISKVQQAYVSVVREWMAFFPENNESVSKRVAVKGKKKADHTPQVNSESDIPICTVADVTLLSFFSVIASYRKCKANLMPMEERMLFISDFLQSITDNTVLRNLVDMRHLCDLQYRECFDLFNVSVQKGLLKQNWEFPNSKDKIGKLAQSMNEFIEDDSKRKNSSRRGKKGTSTARATRSKKAAVKKKATDTKSVEEQKERTEPPVSGCTGDHLHEKLQNLLCNLGPGGDVLILKSTLQLRSLLAGRIDQRNCANYHHQSIAQSLHRHLLSSLRKQERKARKIAKESSEQTKMAEEDRNQVDLICEKLQETQKTIQRYCNPVGTAHSLCQDAVDSLPKDWRICSLSMFNADCKRMMITRVQAGKEPLVFNVPLESKGADWSEEEDDDNDDDCDTLIRGLASAFQTDPLEDLQDILSSSLKSMKVDDVKVWWKQRLHIDKRLERFLSKLENKWLGRWKGILLGQHVDKEKETILAEASRNIALDIERDCGLQIEDGYLKVLLDSSSLLTPSQLRDALKELLGVAFSLEMEKTFHRYAEEVETQFHKMHSKKTKTSKIRRNPVILILDGGLDRLPWESIPVLRNHPVCRMPSLLLTTMRAKSFEPFMDRGVDPEDTFYILNPRKDLPNTQKIFQRQFESAPGWEGIVGRSPTEKEYTSALTDHELFVYCGHGTGSEYLKGDKIQKIKCKAVTLLMGCSSARLKSRGKYESHGMVLSYLLAECPAVVANLWDVTDKDIDRFLERLLQVWSQGEHRALSDSVVSARSACHLPFLIGCSPVVYGLPVNMKR